MRALWYVTKRSTVNSVKKALKKPATYLILCVIVLYIGIFGGMFIGWRQSLQAVRLL